MIIDIICKKRDKQVLSAEEIDFFVKGVYEKRIPDYQISAFCMAVFLNGMNDEETINLTKGFIKYSTSYKWGSQTNKIIDKHSTGGIGDKTSLVIVPIWASLGLKVIKMSGKGLGFTGGTIDKLNSIPGFVSSYTTKEFKKIIKDNDFIMLQGNKEMVPVDKKIYGIRDVTGTVKSIPLIAASIMSKKIILGTKHLVIDLKMGNGSFCKTIDEAEELAAMLIKIATNMNIKIEVIISDMSQPLGKAIGNAIEVKEAYDILQNKGPQTITEFCINLASHGYVMINGKISFEEAKKTIKQNLKEGLVFEKFKEWITLQGGDHSVIEKPNFTKAKYTTEIKSPQDGWIKSFNSNEIGMAAKLLGAGRIKQDDKLDYLAGVYCHFNIGDKVLKNDTIFTLQSSKPISDEIIKLMTNNFIISSKKILPKKKIIKRIVN